MTSTPKQPGGSSADGTAGHRAPQSPGPFMLTLCRLATPVSIQPPRAPHLKSFTFFISRSRQPDGGEQLRLHMGYFATLAEAQHYAQLVRGAYPNATATLAPAALLRQGNSGVPTLPPATAADGALTDTQVIHLLETRRVAPLQDSTSEQSSREISLLRPDDTDTRRALKEAVVQGAPVSFAVQLQWSVQPIDLARVPSVSIFRAYTLYVTEERRDGRSWYCLRLGFFRDSISAKQVAYYVRSNFPSVAVVPISEQERTRANQNSGETLEQTPDLLAPSELWNAGTR